MHHGDRRGGTLDEGAWTVKQLNWPDYRLVEDSQEMGDIVVAIDRQDRWMGAAEPAEGAMGDSPGPTVPPYASRRRFARRLSVHSGRKELREGDYPLLPTFTI